MMFLNNLRGISSSSRVSQKFRSLRCKKINKPNIRCYFSSLSKNHIYLTSKPLKRVKFTESRNTTQLYGYRKSNFKNSLRFFGYLDQLKLNLEEEAKKNPKLEGYQIHIEALIEKRDAFIKKINEIRGKEEEKTLEETLYEAEQKEKEKKEKKEQMKEETIEDLKEDLSEKVIKERAEQKLKIEEEKIIKAKSMPKIKIEKKKEKKLRSSENIIVKSCLSISNFAEKISETLFYPWECLKKINEEANEDVDKKIKLQDFKNKRYIREWNMMTEEEKNEAKIEERLKYEIAIFDELHDYKVRKREEERVKRMHDHWWYGLREKFAKRALERASEESVDIKELEDEENEDINLEEDSLMVAGHEVVWSRRFSQAENNLSKYVDSHISKMVDQYQEKVNKTLKNETVLKNYVEPVKNYVEPVKKLVEPFTGVFDAINELKTQWEESDHPLSRYGRRIINWESDGAKNLNSVLEIDPGFTSRKFSSYMKYYMIPIVLQAFYDADHVVLGKVAEDKALGFFKGDIMRRKIENIQYDVTVTRIKGITLEKIQLHDGVPVVVFMFYVDRFLDIKNTIGEVVKKDKTGSTVYGHWVAKKDNNDEDFDYKITEAVLHDLGFFVGSTG